MKTSSRRLKAKRKKIRKAVNRTEKLAKAIAEKAEKILAETRQSG